MDEVKNVFVWGTFDIIHGGHLEFFKAAKKLGTDLYVVVLPDEYLADRKKIIAKSKNIRKKNLLKTPIIKGVFIDSIHHDNDGLECFDKIRPDVFCFGYDQNTEWDRKFKEYLMKNFPQCQIVQLPMFAEGIHSSHLRGKSNP